MSGLQIFFICFTVLVPPIIWIGSRRLRSDRFDQVTCRVLAVVLLIAEITELSLKVWHEDMGPIGALPMQLCDWALIGVAAALWFRSQTCFELTYFWALAGTLQALFTPAIDADLPTWRQAGFFFVHSAIVIGVLLLMLLAKMRPRGVWRVLIVSEIYLVCALLVNAATGQNYGFLAHKPPQDSLLDLFSDQHWLYVLQINLTALLFFAVLYTPWWVWDRWRARGSDVPRPG